MDPLRERLLFGPNFLQRFRIGPSLAQREGKEQFRPKTLLPKRPHPENAKAARKKKKKQNGGPDPARAVRLPEPTLLPGHGRRQPLPARRQAPRGPRLLQPAPRKGWWQEDGAEIRPGQVLAVCRGTAIRSCAAYTLPRRGSASTSVASYEP